MTTVSNGVIVRWNGARYNSGHDYLVDVGYHNGIVNLRTFAKEPRPLTLNGKTVLNKARAVKMIDTIKKQFSHEDFAYIIQEHTK